MVPSVPPGGAKFAPPGASRKGSNVRAANVLRPHCSGSVEDESLVASLSLRRRGLRNVIQRGLIMMFAQWSDHWNKVEFASLRWA